MPKVTREKYERAPKLCKWCAGRIPFEKRREEVLTRIFPIGSPFLVSE